MSLARLVVTAVRVEGRTKAEVGRDYGVSSRWVYELSRRFDARGEAGLEPRSRRPRRSPQRTAEVLEDEIVAIRKERADLGVDAWRPDDQGPPRALRVAAVVALRGEEMASSGCEYAQISNRRRADGHRAVDHA